MWRDRRLHWARPVLGGCVVGVAVTAMILVLPAHVLVGSFIAAPLLLPPLVLRNATVYGVALYLALLPIEGVRGIIVSKRFLDESYSWIKIVDTLGLPPGLNFDLRILPSDVVLAFLIAGWAVRSRRKTGSAFLPSLAYIALAYFGWAAMSAVLKAPYFYLSAFELAQGVKYVVLYVYIANAVTSQRVLKGIIALLVACLLFEGAVTILAFKSDVIQDSLALLREGGTPDAPSVFEAGEDGKRALGSFGRPVTTALYLDLLMPLAVALAVLKPAGRWLLGAVLLVAGIALYLTYSRTGLVGLALGLGVFGWLACRQVLIRPRQLLVVGYLGLVVGVGLGSMILPRLESFLASRPSALLGRFPLMEKAVAMTVDNPLLGVGPANSTAVKRQLKEGYDNESFYPVHNQYLVVAAETGVVGLLCYVTFFGGVCRQAARLAGSPDRHRAALGLGVTGGYVAVATMLFGDHLAGNAPNAMVWFCAGLVAAARRLDDDARDVGRAASP